MAESAPPILDYAAPLEPRTLRQLWRSLTPPGLRLVLAALLGPIATFAPVVLRISVDSIYLLWPYALANATAVLVIAWRDRKRAWLHPMARISAGAIAIACVAANVGVQDCPHATYLRVGPIFVPIWGKACGNGRYPTAPWFASLRYR